MLPKFFPFRTLVTAIAVTTILSAIGVAAADNSKEIDMSQLTCAEFLQMGRMETMMSIDVHPPLKWPHPHSLTPPPHIHADQTCEFVHRLNNCFTHDTMCE